MQRLTFLLLLAACAIAVSPMDSKSKVAVSSSSAAAGFWVVAKGKAQKSDRKDKLAEGELELATNTRKVAKEQAEASGLRTKMEDELRQIDLQKKDAEIAIALQTKDVELLRAEWEKDKAHLLQQIEKESQAKGEELAIALKKARKKAAERLWRAKNKAWQFRKEIVARGKEGATEELEIKREELEQAIAIAWTEVEKGKADNLRYTAELEKELEEKRLELEKLLNDTLEESLRILEAQKEKEKAEWMVNFTQQYDAKVKEMGNLKTRVRMLQQELHDSRDIKLCRETGLAHSDRANDILIWLKQRHGIYANWLFSSIDEYGIFRMGFDLWVEDPASLKKLEKLMPLLKNRLGCPEEPTIAFGNDATCYILTAMPRSANIQCTAKLEDLYKKSIPDIDLPPGFAGLESNLRDRIANELTFQAEQDFMLSFVPPVPIRPSALAISGEEMTCYRYFMYYQAQATKGKQPNVTTKNELMNLIYGVAPGYSSYQKKDPILLETLSQRYDRVMLILGSKPEQLELTEQENDRY